MDENGFVRSLENTPKKFIDLEEVIRSKSERTLKLLPRFIINYLKRIIHQDEINSFIHNHTNDFGLDFINAALNEMDIKVQVYGKENIPKGGRYIVASNHPLGGPEGLALMSVVGEVREDFKFIANDLLLNLKNIEMFFVPVNKHGSHTKENLKRIEEVYSSDNIVLNFPFGLVSRKRKGEIMDLNWKKSFIAKAKKHKRDIIPVFINGRNSNFFYNLANLRKFFGIKQNIEMLYLVNEMYKQKGNVLDITFGESIPFETFDRSKTDTDWAELVRLHTYALERGEQLSLKTRKINNI